MSVATDLLFYLAAYPWFFMCFLLIVSLYVLHTEVGSRGQFVVERYFARLLLRDLDVYAKTGKRWYEPIAPGVAASVATTVDNYRASNGYLLSSLVKMDDGDVEMVTCPHCREYRIPCVKQGPVRCAAAGSGLKPPLEKEWPDLPQWLRKQRS